jgi:hypothetical protein
MTPVSAPKVTEISVNPDFFHILSATATEVILLGEADDDEFSPAVITVARATYLSALTAWMDDKAGYRERTGYFAGVGHIRFTRVKATGEAVLLNPREIYPWRGAANVDTMVNALAYTACGFEVDMEHG